MTSDNLNFDVFDTEDSKAGIQFDKIVPRVAIPDFTISTDFSVSSHPICGKGAQSSVLYGNSWIDHFEMKSICTSTVLDLIDPIL